ncbi:MAG: oligosaccharide flippase family protein [Candidatus Krumholzibacteriota bacterium]|nr:oligosaccharide flippase family protein [Candidatus Krumholzibacteriota bacterium]
MTDRPDNRDSFAAGYLWSFGATAFPLAGIFVASLIVARWMGPETIGLVSLTMAVATFVLIGAKFGIDGAASRLLSEYAVSDPGLVPVLVRSSLVLRALFTVPLAAGSTLAAPLLARLFHDPALVPLFQLGGLLIVSVSLNELVALLVIGLGRFRTLFSMRASMFLLRVGLVAAAAALAGGAAGVIAAYCAAAFLPGIAVLARLSAPRPGSASAKKPPVMRRLLHLSVPLAVSGASVTIYSILDKLMLGYYSGAEPVGLYAVSRSVVEASLFPTFALVMALRPALAAAWSSGDRPRCAALARGSLRSSLVYALCVVVVFAALAGPLVTGLFTERFLPSAGLLVLFLPLVVMRCLGAVILPGLVAADRAGTYARLTVAGAALNFALNAALIPRFGAGGAVAATLLSYMPIEVLGLRAVGRAFPGLWRREDTAAAVRAAAVGAAIVILYRSFVPLPAGLPATILHAAGLTVFYAAGVLVAKVVAPGEARAILRSLARRGRPANGLPPGGGGRRA